MLLIQVCFIYFQVLSITTLCPGIGFGLACDTLMSQVCEKCPSSPFPPPPVIGNIPGVCHTDFRRSEPAEGGSDPSARHSHPVHLLHTLLGFPH